jgi:hypothetical protein
MLIFKRTREIKDAQQKGSVAAPDNIVAQRNNNESQPDIYALTFGSLKSLNDNAECEILKNNDTSFKLKFQVKNANASVPAVGADKALHSATAEGYSWSGFFKWGIRIFLCLLLLILILFLILFVRYCLTNKKIRKRWMKKIRKFNRYVAHYLSPITRRISHIARPTQQSHHSADDSESINTPKSDDYGMNINDLMKLKNNLKKREAALKNEKEQLNEQVMKLYEREKELYEREKELHERERELYEHERELYEHEKKIYERQTALNELEKQDAILENKNLPLRETKAEFLASEENKNLNIAFRIFTSDILTSDNPYGFRIDDIDTNYMQGIYLIKPISNTEARLKINPDSAAQRNIMSSVSILNNPACEPFPVIPSPKEILTRREGFLLKENNIWVIKQKMIIELE